MHPNQSAALAQVRQQELRDRAATSRLVRQARAPAPSPSHVLGRLVASIAVHSRARLPERSVEGREVPRPTRAGGDPARPAPAPSDPTRRAPARRVPVRPDVVSPAGSRP